MVINFRLTVYIPPIKRELAVEKETISTVQYTGVPIKIEPKDEYSKYRACLDELVECSLCGMKLKRGQLSNHGRSHKKKIDKCVHCDKVFKYKHQTLIHIKHVHEKDHSNVATILCDICGKMLRHHNLSNHKNMMHGPDSESDTKKYICEKCGKSFRCEMFLKRHYMTKAHNDDMSQTSRKKRIRERKDYKCHFCEKLLTSQASLKTHIRIHTGERPFVCPDCPKRFRSRIHLMSHRVVHTKERPYACKICSKSYTQRGPLRHHIKKTHPPEIVDN